MFCSKCGKEISDNAAFCPGCGTATNAQAAPAAPASAAPVATAAAKPSAFAQLFGSFLGVLKGVFSKNIVKTVGEQAKNTGLEWVFGIALSLLTFAFAAPVNIVELAADAEIDEGFPFFGFFGMSLLLGIIVLGVTVAGLWLLAKLVTKKDVAWPCVLNMDATATLPLSVCYLANMLLGLIWWPLPLVATTVALFMTGILLYAGFQKLEKPEASPFFPFMAFAAVVVIVALLFAALLYKAPFKAYTDDFYGAELYFVLIANVLR